MCVGGGREKHLSGFLRKPLLDLGLRVLLFRGTVLLRGLVTHIERDGHSFETVNFKPNHSEAETAHEMQLGDCRSSPPKKAPHKFSFAN